MTIYTRTCQECGHIQHDVSPKGMNPASFDRYCNRKCKKCKSEGSLDYGKEIMDNPDAENWETD